MINLVIRSIGYAILLATLLQAGTFTVSYLSHEHVYLNGGKADGITIGTILAVKRKQTTIAQLQVVYAAQHSASCKILEKTGEIKAGDEVEILESKIIREGTALPEKIIAVNKAPSPITRPENKSRVKSDISGYLALQWFRFHDRSDNKYHFDQPGVRFKLKARNLWSRSLSLEIKTRSRYYDRHGRSSATVSATEWRHRLYSAAIIYDNPVSGIGLRAGRILSPYISGAGYIDGVQMQYMLNKTWQAGLFAGFQPEWKTSSFQPQRRKYGTFLRYRTAGISPWQAQASIAAVGEYHENVVSREFFYMQSSLNFPGSWHVFHSMEIDINRQWRQERTGNNIALSSLYLSGSKQISPLLSAQLTYDNRQNYYTYDYYSLSDSLFDDAFRHGLRFYLNFKIHRDYRLSINSGIRKQKDQNQTTYSHGIRATILRLFMERLSLTARGALFTNLYSKGINYGLNLSQRMMKGHEIALHFGSQQYQLQVNSERYNNYYLRLQGYVVLPYHLNLYTYYEYDFGDDIKGQNIFAELGYYF
jgi:hypothetical protein